MKKMQLIIKNVSKDEENGPCHSTLVELQTGTSLVTSTKILNGHIL